MYRHALMGSCSVLFVSLGSLAALSTLFLAQGAPQRPTGQSKAHQSSGERAKPSFLVLPYLQMPTPTGITVMWETNQKLPGRVEFGVTTELGQSVENGSSTGLHEIRLQGLQPGTRYCYRVTSGQLTSETYSFKTAPPLGTTKWRMALYGDSRSNPAVHHQIAERIKEANVDLILHTGDIVLNGTLHDGLAA